MPPHVPDLAGQVLIKYNHYKELVSITHPPGGSASVSSKTLAELFSLEYAFTGNFIVNLNKTARLDPENRFPKNKHDEFIPGIVLGSDAAVPVEYFVDVDEDAVAEAAIERKAYVAAATPASNPMIGGTRKEGCSCLYGNPCAESEHCENWQGRFEVAKKNGWKGYS